MELLLRHKGVLRAMRGSRYKIDQSLLSVYDMAKMGYRSIFEIDANGVDRSHAIHIQTGERMDFVLVGRSWELEFDVVPYLQAKATLDKAKRLAPFQEGGASSSVPSHP